jgi:hypothetical protein
MANLISRKPNVQRLPQSDGGSAHAKGQKGKARKQRDQSGDVPRDKSGITVVLSGLAAAASAALDTQGGGPVVPALVQQRTGGRGHTQRLGSELPGEHGSTGLDSDAAANPLPQPDHLHHQRIAEGHRSTEGHAKPSSLTPAKGRFVELDPAKDRIDFLEDRLASVEDARARQKQQWGAFFVERDAWLDAVAKAVRPARAKFFAYVLFRARDGLCGGQLVRRDPRKELAKQMRMHENTVRYATKLLVAAGKLKVFYRYDPKTRRNEPNEYWACGYTLPRKPRKWKPPF